MRIIVIRTPTAREVDGLDLSGFNVGRQYEVGTRLGSYLVAARWADFIDPSGKRVARGPDRRARTDRRKARRVHRSDRRRADRRIR
jgi:hypothetical protein